MPADLVPISPTRTVEGVARVARLDAPAPGSYWRLRKAIKGTHTDRTRTNAMAAGTVLMLAAVERADGIEHAYHFAPHPSLPQSEQVESVFHAEDLWTWWEPAPDGEAVRARELAAVMAGMDETRLRLMQPPPDAAPVALLAHDPTQELGGEGAALATSEQLDAMLQRAELIKADAEARTAWIQTHTKALTRQGNQIARFHQERAQAVLARAKGQLESVEGVLKTVANLRLYTGEGVDVLQLRDGVGAPADARVTFYQERLALDEEALILLDQGGLDHTRVDSLVEALRDPALLNRLIPSPRGAVLCRFRNSYKEFQKARSIEDAPGVAYVNAALNDASRQNRLLVRDGERLYLVDVPHVLSKIEQLLPSTAEQSAYFRQERWNEPPKELRPEDLDYARAQRIQMHRLDAYAQVLILLWGLRDRDMIFADSHVPRYSNWLDEGFQRAWLALVSQDTMLGVERPDFRRWQSEENELLVAGSWVAVHLSKAFTHHRAPGGFSYSSGYGGRGSYNTVYSPVSDELIERVRADKDGFYVDVPCLYDGNNADCDGKTRNIKLYLRYFDTRHRERDAEGWLVLDRAHAPDLTYYLESRKQRREYAAYVKLFAAARKWVLARDAAEAPVRQQLRDAVAAAQLAPDPAHLERAIKHAMAVARASRRERTVPTPSTAAFRTFFEAALNLLHASIVDNGSRIAAVDSWAAQAGRQPLRLVLTPKGVWRLYLVPDASEHDARLGTPVHATVATLAFGAAALRVECQGRELLRARPGEKVVHDWNWPDAPANASRHGRGPTPAGAKRWLRLEPPVRLDYAAMRAALDVPALAAEPPAAGDLRDLVHAGLRYARAAGRSLVSRMPLTLVVGTVLRETGREDVPLVAELLTISCDAWEYAYHRGDEATRREARHAVRSIYASKDVNEAELVNSKFAWVVGRVPLTAATRMPTGIGDVMPGDVVRPASFKAGRGGSRPLVLTALNPVGAREVPWLVEFAQAPTA